MNTKEPAAKHPRPGKAGMIRLVEELNREDSELRSHLLDAALAGLRLARNPESRELRRDAAHTWGLIEPIISRHLDAEDSWLVPWLDQQAGLAVEVGRRVHECNDRLRILIGAIAKTDTDHLTKTEACDAGRALSGLAVYLDDAIDDEKRRLFPTIQKALFRLDLRVRKHPAMRSQSR